VLGGREFVARDVRPVVRELEHADAYPEPRRAGDGCRLPVYAGVIAVGREPHNNPGWVTASAVFAGGVA
jgi:hypothetical protein